MNPEDQYPTLRDRFHARWSVIAAVIGAVAGAFVGAGATHLVSRDVTGAKLVELRQDFEKERARADSLELRLRQLGEKPEVGRFKESSISSSQQPAREPSGSRTTPMQASLERPASSPSGGAAAKIDGTAPTPNEKPGPIATTTLGLNFSEPSCVHTSSSSIRCNLFIINTDHDKSLRLFVKDEYFTGKSTQIIDDQGNTYPARKIALANRDGFVVESTLISEVPTKVVISFEGLSEPVASIARLNLMCLTEGQYFTADFGKLSVSK